MRAVKGFTLLELILYIAMLAMISLMVSVVLNTLLQARQNIQQANEVNEQAALLLLKLTAAVRNAELITYPAAGQSGSNLQLVTADPGSTSLRFELQAGVLGVVEGSSAWQPLSTSAVQFEDFFVTEVSGSGAAQAIRFEFTLFDGHNFSATANIH